MRRWLLRRYWGRVAIVALVLALLVAAMMFVRNGWGWLALDYVILALTVAFVYAWTTRASKRMREFGYRMGYRAARFEFWQSFHEGVLKRGLHPHEWLIAESERDEPRIAVIVPGDGDDL